ncbi:MAG: response regulator transcription factor [Myxococcota bacterium]
MSRARLVLADDHGLMLEGLAVVLLPHFDIIARVDDGLALVEEVERSKPDVVVSDISMPQLDGLAAAGRIRRISPETKIVLVTMKHDPAMARQALQIGASGYVLKTEAPRQLVVAVQKALEGGTYIGPGLRPEGTEDLAAAKLTTRQLQVLRLLGQGLTMPEVGQKLNISARTVAFHKYRVMEVLGIESNAALIRYAHSMSLDDQE